MVNIMAKFGGKQPGSGRPKGAANKKTQELITKATEGGITPLELLLGDMRFFNDMALDIMSRLHASGKLDEQAQEEYKKALGYKTLAKDYAKDAAPYVHPKLTSVEANVTLSNHEKALQDLRK